MSSSLKNGEAKKIKQSNKPSSIYLTREDKTKMVLINFINT